MTKVNVSTKTKKEASRSLPDVITESLQNADVKPDSLGEQVLPSSASVELPEKSLDQSSEILQRARDEYKDLSDNIRHYNTHILAVLTLFSAIEAGLIRIFFGEEKAARGIDMVFVVVIGLIVTASCWIQSEIYLSRQISFERRLIELEGVLDYRQYSLLAENKNRQKFKPPRIGRWSWRSLFLSLVILWLYALVRNDWHLLSMFGK